MAANNQQTEFDVVVIGAGPAGYEAAVRAAELGLRTACIDKGEALGGTCLNVGCIPSKALLQSTEDYDWLQKKAVEHGITAKEVSFDLDVMMQRKDKIVGGFRQGIASLFKKHKVERFSGAARFVDPQTVAVSSKEQTEQTVKARHFIIATGSEPIALPFLPFDEKIVVSSTGALSLKKVPKHLVVIGGGAIGVELASVYRRLGSEVTIVEMLKEITPPMDPLLRKQLLHCLKKQGIDFILGAKVSGAESKGDGVVLTLESEEKKQTVDADVVLVAIGRRPYTKDLNLDAIGVQVTSKGFIPVDGMFRTSQQNVYAVGDVIEGPMLAHRASFEGVAVAEFLAGKKPSINYISIPNVIYTHPEVAGVGLTEEEAKAANLEIAIGTSSFASNGRARCAGETDGEVKVIAEKKSGRLVGLHIIGPHASELIAEGIVALDKQATVKELAQACHPHPTLSEVVMEACQNI